MNITKRAISRRTILRGTGTALALPLLDSMAPAFTGTAKPVVRFGAVYVPNGINMRGRNWTPSAEGANFEFTPILKPLEPFRDRMVILTGLNSIPPKNAPGPVHGRASTRFLTDVPPKPTAGADLHAGISMDQIAARELGKYTQLASLEIGIDSKDSSGTADAGVSRAYSATISWSSPTTPLPMENNPRDVFERLFGETGSTDPAARQARMRQKRSILDSVTRKVADLQRGVGPGDRAKLDEYFEAIRDAERRIQKAEEQSGQRLPVIQHPPGIPASFEEHMKLMFDLHTLAYQCDLTRVATFMVGQEFTGRTYPEIDVHDGHHATSHHQNDPVRLEKLVRINTYHTKLLAYFLEKLRSTPDGDGSLLDHIVLLYGSGMSDGNAHDPRNLPILLLGGGAGRIKGGRHLVYTKDEPLANLHLALLDKLGLRAEHIGDSSGMLAQI